MEFSFNPGRLALGKHGTLRAWNLGQLGSSISLNRGVTVKTLSALLAAALLATLCGCNTVEGAGKDVKATGQAVENAADKAKPK
jgi:entericidin B